jgi:hypothetical protein
MSLLLSKTLFVRENVPITFSTTFNPSWPYSPLRAEDKKLRYECCDEGAVFLTLPRGFRVVEYFPQPARKGE